MPDHAQQTIGFTINPNSVITFAELSKMLGIAASDLMAEVHAGRLAVRRIGGHSVVIGEDLANYLGNLPKTTGR